VAILAAAGLAISAGASAAGTSKDRRDMAVKDAAVQYASDKVTCSSMSGNAKDVCVRDAKDRYGRT
jgi:hypothetical protein